MVTLTLSLSSTLSSSPISPPFPPNPKHSNSFSYKSSNAVISRRGTAILLTIAPFLLQIPSPAFAFDLGISGPKDWLREQKKKSIKYVLAPIDASQEILRHAYQLLMAKDSSFEQKDLEEIRGMLTSAARDCVTEDRNSLVAFQARTGVEVCTFKLVVTNAASLLDDDDSAKLEAEARLSDLIRSFTFLNGVAKEADFQLVPDRQKVANAVMDSLSSLNNFEQSIKGCIEV
ncbi:hypothetical protein SOVF_205960 [Spinacia oleracea]|uniref:Uncharacterized protein isoform X1 n=1 Tax=Spinacia oleracea TaxID=3562 RepID=A0A9R0JVD7_SPIOL|nr:uncharacterized protein LOC110787644 isoform X1 [Spinacia oleracea]KNA03768.1 hypothetical protein SOVF_205960 [Spinacia oleracea]